MPGDFTGSPVIRTQSFHYCGIPGWGTKIPQVTRHSQKKKSKINKSRSYGYILGESSHFLLSTYYRCFSPCILHEFFLLLGEQPYSPLFFTCLYLTQLFGLSSDTPGQVGPRFPIPGDPLPPPNCSTFSASPLVLIFCLGLQLFIYLFTLLQHFLSSLSAEGKNHVVFCLLLFPGQAFLKTDGVNSRSF